MTSFLKTFPDCSSQAAGRVTRQADKTRAVKFQLAVNLDVWKEKSIYYDFYKAVYSKSSRYVSLNCSKTSGLPDIQHSPLQCVRH